MRSFARLNSVPFSLHRSDAKLGSCSATRETILALAAIETFSTDRRVKKQAVCSPVCWQEISGVGGFQLLFLPDSWQRKGEVCLTRGRRFLDYRPSACALPSCQVCLHRTILMLFPTNEAACFSAYVLTESTRACAGQKKTL